MEGGRVWVSTPLLFATVSTCAGATLVSIIGGMRPRGWAKPGLPGSCGVCLGPSFWGDGSVLCGVTFISSILPWWRQGRRTVGNKQEAALLPSWSLQGAVCQELLSTKGLTGAQPAAVVWNSTHRLGKGMVTHGGARKKGGHTGRGQASVLEGARVEWVCRKWSAGDGAFCRSSSSSLCPGRGWSSCLHSSHLLWVINLLKKGLSSWGAEGPELPHASAEATFVQCLCKWSSHSQRTQGLRPPGVTNPVLLCSSHWKSWWRCCSKEMDTCLCSTDLLFSWCSLSRMKQGAVLIQFAQSLHIPSLCAVSGVKSTLSGVPLTKWASLLVSHGFIYMFFSLIRKENVRKWKFPVTVSVVVTIFEAILVSLCVPLNYPSICSAFSGLGVQYQNLNYNQMLCLVYAVFCNALYPRLKTALEIFYKDCKQEIHISLCRN